jgi:hypothetical protein
MGKVSFDLLFYLHSIITIKPFDENFLCLWVKCFFVIFICFFLLLYSLTINKILFSLQNESRVVFLWFLDGAYGDVWQPTFGFHYGLLIPTSSSPPFPGGTCSKSMSGFMLVVVFFFFCNILNF